MKDNYESLMKTARKTNLRRDEYEQEVGFGIPRNQPPKDQIRTVMMAIEAGIRGRDWPCVAEAQAMLEDLVKVV